MRKIVGNTDYQGAVFVYKNDGTEQLAWADVNAINTTHGGIRGELHTDKTHFINGLKTWNTSVDPINAFLCIYAHMGTPGLNCVAGMTPSAVTWQELADALPKGVQYLWLVGCDSQECMKTWSPLSSPVRHRLLATSKDECWKPLLRVFAAEISINNITCDDKMTTLIAGLEPDLSKHTHYFKPQAKGFVAD
jgi:hypothetical protein